MIIDIHTHAFPDRIAEKAMTTLQAETDEVRAVLDGRLSSLLASMDSAGIDAAVLANIATRPGQFDSIFAWSGEIRSERIIPFLSVHPEDPEALERVRRIAEAGFRGIKLHPYYQEFRVGDPGMLPLYRAIAEAGLVLLLHSGFDVAFPRERVADPAQIASVLDRVPDLTLVAAHFGGWEDWDLVERHLVGRRLYLDTSYSFGMIPEAQARRIIDNHGTERLLFGSDSPWADQGATLEALRGLDLGQERERAMLGENAWRLIGGPAEIRVPTRVSDPR